MGRTCHFSRQAASQPQGWCEGLCAQECPGLTPQIYGLAPAALTGLVTGHVYQENHGSYPLARSLALPSGARRHSPGCAATGHDKHVLHKSSMQVRHCVPGPSQGPGRSPRDVSAPSKGRGGGLQCWLGTQVPPPHGCQGCWPSDGEDTASRFEAVHATAALAWGSSGMAACSRTQRERAAGRASIYAHVSRERGEFAKCKFASPDHSDLPYMYV